jgi:hypothetical protein
MEASQVCWSRCGTSGAKTPCRPSRCKTSEVRLSPSVRQSRPPGRGTYRKQIEATATASRDPSNGRTKKDKTRIKWDLQCSWATIQVRPCIPNFKPNIRVGFRVGTSFLQYPKFDFNIIFSKNLETPVFDLKTGVSKLLDPKTGFFWLKRFFDQKNRKLFPNYFREIFASSKRPDISEKFPNFDNFRINYSEIRENNLENSVFRRALKSRSVF